MSTQSLSQMKIAIKQLLAVVPDNWLHYYNRNIALALQSKALATTALYVEKHMQQATSLSNKYEVLKFALREVKLDGLYVEFGVYKGDSINYIANLVNQKIIYGFDSFEGLPEFWMDGYQKGAFFLKKIPPVRKNVTLTKGWFTTTLPKFFKKNKEVCAFIHIDSDLYSSAKTIFEVLEGRITSGTILVFDEFFNYPGWEHGEYKAFMEFIAAKKLRFTYLCYNRSGEQVAIKITNTRA